jgi:hypothetical protein
MRWLLAILLIFVVAVATAQTSGTSIRSPKEVVEEFWKLEITGERLTPEGWNRTNRYFVHAIPPPSNSVIRVINASSVWDPIARDFHAVPDGTAEIEVGVLGVWGIASDMRFFVASKTMKSGVLYKLVLTSLHWEQGTGETSAIPLGGPLEWRIGERDNTIWLGPDAALRYVSDIRDRTTDPEIRKNSTTTIRKLKVVAKYATR